MSANSCANIQLTAPIKLMPNRVWRTSMGGCGLDALHGLSSTADTHFPEDWIMSTVSARNAGREEFAYEGLGRLASSGIFLRDLIQDYPVEALGSSHYEKYGSSVGVLAKVIDMAERTTIQCHPDKETALRLFGSPYGKTECWHIISVRGALSERPCIYLGFKDWVTRKYWQDAFKAQDISAMLNCINRFEVSAGDTFIIRAGIPHAVGAGCMFFEMQEPTDFTVRTERISSSGYPISDYMCHQGLGFDKMFDCFKYDGASYTETYEKSYIPQKILVKTSEYTKCELVGYGDTNCFKLDKYSLSKEYEIERSNVFSAIYIQSGSGAISCNGSVQSLNAGDQFFLPSACLNTTLTADVKTGLSFFRCFGPNIL